METATLEQHEILPYMLVEEALPLTYEQLTAATAATIVGEKEKIALTERLRKADEEFEEKHLPLNLDRRYTI